MDKEKTGKLIREARIKSGYTQAELGDMLGVSNKAVSRWEKGDSFPDVGILENLATCLNINIEDLICGENTTTENNKIAELTRIVRLQAKESLRRRKDIMLNMVLMIILCVRFYLAFIAEQSNSLELKYDLALLFLCYLIMLYANKKYWINSLGRNLVYSKIVCILTTISALCGIIFIYGGFYALQTVLIQFIKPGIIGPLFSYLLASIVLLNIILLEYTLYELSNKHADISITPIINIGTIFTCCTFRDWLGTLSSFDYLLKTSVILLCSATLAISLVFIRKKYSIQLG